MGHIQLLTKETINQIAAGEVVENPASVVKELIENSVDAKADRVVVEIERGGFEKICVSDNGEGMSVEDMHLCLERHATSKIRKAADLESILSMGFRGEALASISAISKLSLISSQGEGGAHLIAEGGSLLSVKTAARSRGSTVEVCALFYNVLPRLKFQKSAMSSQNAILKMITKLALAYPFLELKYVADGRELLSSFGRSSEVEERAMRQVIGKVLGGQFLEEVTPLHLKEGGCEVIGFIGTAQRARKNRTGQYLFVNERAIESIAIAKGIEEGYGTQLAPHTHPLFVLHLKLPPHWIDVNVHPQKKEIRLLKTEVIGDFLQRALLQTFQKKEGQVVAVSAKKSFEKRHSWVDHKESDYLLREEKREEPPSLIAQELPIIGFFSHYLILDSQLPSLSSFEAGGIILVDLQIADSLIAFEAIMDRFEKRKEMQTLLLPVTFECALHEKEQITSHLETFEKIGIGIRPFGDKAFVIDAIDPHLDQEDLASLIRQLLPTLEQSGAESYLEKEQKKKLALKVVCFAKSQKRSYSLEYAQAIVKKLFQTKSPHYGPTGKPTYLYLSRDQIKNYFS